MLSNHVEELVHLGSWQQTSRINVLANIRLYSFFSAIFVKKSKQAY